MIKYFRKFFEWLEKLEDEYVFIESKKRIEKIQGYKMTGEEKALLRSLVIRDNYKWIK